MIPHRALRALLIFPALILAALALVACGGGGGGDNSEDPQKVLEATFSGDKNVNSGVVKLSLNAAAKGGDREGDFEVSFGGPFESEGDKFPSFDFDVAATGSGGGQDIDFKGGLISSGDKGFVTYKDTNYVIADKTFTRITSQYETQAAKQDPDQATSLLSTLGIKPAEWLEGVKNDGTEDVEGTETIHISGQANVGLFVDDLQKLLKRVGNQIPGGRAPSAQSLGRLEESIKTADFDIYSGADDDILRRLDAALVIEPSKDVNAQFDSLNLNFSLTLSGLNEDQTIEAPKDAKPLSGLLEQLGAGALLGGGGSSGGAGGSGANSAQSQRYLECLRKAQGSAAIQNCAKLLQ